MKADRSSARDRTGNLAYLVYEDSPQYDLWLKWIIGGTLALTLVLGIVFLPFDVVGALAMFGVTVFDALLFNAILPRRYQIYQDRLRIVLGKPFAFNISFDTIKEARPAGGSTALVYGGIRFATSAKSVVEIVRSKGLNIVISPANRDAFLEQLSQALRAVSNSK